MIILLTCFNVIANWYLHEKEGCFISVQLIERSKLAKGSRLLQEVNGQHCCKISLLERLCYRNILLFDIYKKIKILSKKYISVLISSNSTFRKFQYLVNETLINNVMSLFLILNVYLMFFPQVLGRHWWGWLRPVRSERGPSVWPPQGWPWSSGNNRYTYLYIKYRMSGIGETTLKQLNCILTFMFLYIPRDVPERRKQLVCSYHCIRFYIGLGGVLYSKAKNTQPTPPFPHPQ